MRILHDDGSDRKWERCFFFRVYITFEMRQEYIYHRKQTKTRVKTERRGVKES